MERASKLANNMRKNDQTVQKQQDAAFRGYMYLASEMSKQAGIYDETISGADLKRFEDLGRRWAKSFDGDMYLFDTQFLPSEMKEKFNL